MAKPIVFIGIDGFRKASPHPMGYSLSKRRPELFMISKIIAPVLVGLSFSHSAYAVDIAGAWQVRGSVFFNAVVTICHFKIDNGAIGATCESDGQPGPFTQATLANGLVTWSWDSGPAVLTFQGKLISDTTMKGDIKVRGFTGSFTATKQ